MPRTLQEILDHADELADYFESDEFGTKGQIRDASTLRDLSRAVQQRAEAEARIAEAVAVARADGQAWSAIGLMLGTSGEAARQRHGQAQRTKTASAKSAKASARSSRVMKTTTKASRIGKVAKKKPSANAAARVRTSGGAKARGVAPRRSG